MAHPTNWKAFNPFIALRCRPMIKPKPSTIKHGCRCLLAYAVLLGSPSLQADEAEAPATLSENEALATPSAQPASQRSPSEVVTEFQNDLLEIMKQAQTLSYAQRFERLTPTIKGSHDLARIAKITLGRGWKQLNPEQRQRFVQIFSELSIATYVYNFAGYGGEKFKFLGADKTLRGEPLIRTLFVDAQGNEITMDYVLKKSSNGWLIVNIIASGVSDLALKRTEFTNIFKREGFASLIRKLQEKIATYQSSATAAAQP